MLLISGLVVLAMTLCNKRELFSIISLILIIVASLTQVYDEAYTIKQMRQGDCDFLNNFLLCNAMTAQIFSWFHYMFALQYLRASFTVVEHIKVNQTQAEIRESESRI